MTEQLAKDLVAALVSQDKGKVRALGRAIYAYGDHAQFGTDDEIRNALQTLRNVALSTLVV